MGDKLTRAELARFLPTHRAVKAWEENVDTASAGVDAAAVAQATANSAVLAAATAQTTANTAVAAAATAQGTANGAAVAAANLALPSYVTLAVDPALANERTLAVDVKALKLTDGGAGAPVTLASADLVAILGADVSDNTAAFVDATGLVLALLANATYLVEALLTVQSAAVTTGMAFTFTLPAGATLSGRYQHNVTTTTSEGGYNNAAGAVSANTTSVPVANDNLPVLGRWVITTAGTAGNAQLRFRSEVAASLVTIKSLQSVLVARRLA